MRVFILLIVVLKTLNTTLVVHLQRDFGSSQFNSPTIIEFNRTQKASHTFFEPQPFAPSLFGAKNEFQCLCPNRANYPRYQVADILSEEKVLKHLLWTLIQSLSSLKIHPFVKQLIIVEKKVLSNSGNLSRLSDALRPKCQS